MPVTLRCSKVSGLPTPSGARVSTPAILLPENNIPNVSPNDLLNHPAVVADVVGYLKGVKQLYLPKRHLTYDSTAFEDDPLLTAVVQSGAFAGVTVPQTVEAKPVNQKPASAAKNNKRKAKDTQEHNAKERKQRKKKAPSEPAEPAISSATLVTKAVDMLETFVMDDFSKMRNAEDHYSANVGSTTESQEEEATPGIRIPERDLKRLSSELGSISSRSLMNELPVEHLSNVIGILDKQIQDGISVDVFSVMHLGRDDAEWNTSGVNDRQLIQRMLISIRAAIVILCIMSGDGIDRRLLMEETIENCLLLWKHLATRWIMPALDPTSTIFGEDDRKDGVDADFEGPDDVKPRQGKAAKARVSKSPAKTPRLNKKRKNLDAISDDPELQKVYSKLSKDVLKLVPAVCELAEAWTKFIACTKLDDKIVLQMSNVTINLFFIESNQEARIIQLSSIEMLRVLFSAYSPHRSIMIEDLLGFLSKLPLGKRNLRTYKLTNSSTSIQMFSALVMLLVQSCVSTARSTLTSGRDPTVMEESLEEVALRSASEAAQSFVTAFLKRCSRREEDLTSRQQLFNFTEDLLTVMGMPDWPVAETLLNVLCSSLATVLSVKTDNKSNSKSLESSYGLMALDILGKVCAGVRNLMCESKCLDLGQEADYLSTSHLQRELIESEIAAAKPGAAEDTGDSIDDMSTLVSTIVPQQLLCNHFVARMRLEPSLQYAMQYLLATWAKTARQSDDSDIAYNHWIKQWDISSQSLSSLNLEDEHPTLSNNLTAELSKLFFSRNSLCSGFDRLLGHIMRLLGESQPTYRAHVLKALDSIIIVDPLLMADNMVRQSVQLCFHDEAISVRQAAVDLVGKYVIKHTKLVDTYYDLILERLMDKGVSVRKSVVKIYRNMLLQNPNFSRRTEVCVRLVVRMGDLLEEESIKELIEDTFEELWFGKTPDREPAASLVETPRPVTTATSTPSAPSSAVYGDTPVSTPATTEPTARSTRHTPRAKVADTSSQESLLSTVVQIVEVISKVPASSWLAQLLERLLFGPGEGNRPKRDRGKERKALRKRCEDIVQGVIDQLLHVEEGNKLSGTMSGESSDHVLGVLDTLDVFCKASPDLLCPHFSTLVIYLKGDPSMGASREQRLLRTAANIIDHILPLLDRIEQRVVNTLEADLKNLIYRCPPSVVGPCIKCLAALTSHSSYASYRPSLHDSVLFQILKQFYAYLFKFRKSVNLRAVANDQKAKINANLQRALYVVGLIAQNLDLQRLENGKHSLSDDEDVSGDTSEQLTIEKSVPLQLYSVLSCYTKAEQNPALLMKCIQSLGFLFTRYPKFMLKAEQAGVLGVLLGNSQEDVVRQCMLSFADILKFEEERIEGGLARKQLLKKSQKSEQVKGDQDADASVIGGIMQMHIKRVLQLMMNKDIQMRTAAVELVGTILRQGLVSPTICAPHLVALETDHDASVRDCAHTNLVRLSEKFHAILVQSVAEGIRLSMDFQRKLFGSWRVTFVAPNKETLNVFGRLYASCIRPNRSSRTNVLKKLVGTMDEASIFPIPKQAAMKTHENASLDMELVLYTAELLGTLPFDVQEEPLLIIYQIGRYSSLKGGSLCDKIRKWFQKYLDIDFEGLDEEEVESLPLEEILGKEQEYQNGVKADGLLAKALPSLYALIVSMYLRDYLKALYHLNDARCEAFSPLDAAKTNQRPLTRGDVLQPLGIPFTASHENWQSLETMWTMFTTLLRLLRGGSNITLLPTKSTGGKGRRSSKGESGRKSSTKRRRSKKHAGLEDDEDEGDEQDIGVDGEGFYM